MTFYTDENISEYLARMAGLFDRTCTVCAHIDHFKKGTPDDIWSPQVSAWSPKPICILGDGRILRTPTLKLVARESDMTFVVVGESFMNLPWEDQAWKFIKMWPAVVRAVRSVRRATIFDVGVKSMKVQARMPLANL